MRPACCAASAACRRATVAPSGPTWGAAAARPWHSFHRLPLPQGHGALRDAGGAYVVVLPKARRRRRQYEPGAAKFSKRVYSPMNVSRTVPIGPLRCLPMMISATPLSCVSWL